MSNKALTWAFGLQLANPGAKFVLVALADHASDHAGEDWTCFPSNERLGEFTSMPARTIERHIAWLEAEGWITREAPIDRRGRKMVRHYQLHRAGRPETPAALALGRDCPPANLAGGEDAGPPAKNPPVHPPKNGAPPANLAGGHNIAEPPEPSVTPTERARAGEPDGDDGGGKVADPPVDPFGEVLAEWLAASARAKSGRTSPEAAKLAWDRATVTLDPARLAAAARAALAGDQDFKRRGPGSFERWLDKGLFATWLLAEGSAAGPGQGPAASPSVPGWPAPPDELRTAFASAFTPAQVASYWPGGWKAADRILIANTGVARDWLRSNARTWLAANTLTVISRSEAGLDQQE